eukprot:TRINITY_DN3825_c0_g3_i1.p1 TRINITY_DN3825_c0_g3~~TRINITY_DN3825_c0_g3_i1.p1  ORF type:complete len:351 (+),score=151.79 TRINITY_DN3825_c0_g3_i1:274-1326(+)
MKNTATNAVTTVRTPEQARPVLPGTYTICDALPPNQYNWYSTSGDLCRTFTIKANAPCESVLFTCLCTGAGGAQTPTNWLAASGLASITADDLAALRQLNLKDGSLADFDPTTAASLKTWYNDAMTSANQAAKPAWFLSAQLAMMTLNMRHYVDPSNFMKAPGLASFMTITNQFARLSAITAKADAMLANFTVTPATQLTTFATTLKDFNANQNFAQTSPCSFTWPAGIDGATASDSDGAATAANTAISSPAVVGIVAAVVVAAVLAGVTVYVVRRRMISRSQTRPKTMQQSPSTRALIHELSTGTLDAIGTEDVGFQLADLSVPDATSQDADPALPPRPMMAARLSISE